MSMKNKSFKEDTSINAILYILQKLGGSCDMHKLSKIFYFADQKHLSDYARTITGDVYVAMQYGPVPSKINDIMKAVRGDSYFQYPTDKFEFTDRYTIRSKQDADLDYLSGSDLECLDYAIDLCKNKSFSELTEFSHRLAWNKGRDNKDNSISFADMLLEMNDEEEYIAYVVSKMEMTEKLQML